MKISVVFKERKIAVEENSNIQEEVKTEIKQENNQDDEIEILEVEEVKEKKKGFFQCFVWDF